MHGVVSKYAFDAFSVFMIVLNMVTMMAIRANPSKSEDDYQVWMGNTLAIWYMLEAYLLIVAMKWTNYWQSGWNKIDFIVAGSWRRRSTHPGCLREWRRRSFPYAEIFAVV